MSPRKRVKVLVVDDSALVRQTMSRILSADREIEVVGTASDPFLAAGKIQKVVPNVITLDIEMPRMDGLEFLRKLMQQHPIPVVVCSALAQEGAETTIRALELGAVEVIAKPQLGASRFLEESRILICQAVKAASQAVMRKLPSHPLGEISPKLTADAVLSPPVGRVTFSTTEKVVVVGASTGGTEAIRYLLQNCPHDTSGMVIVQHMPEHFTKAFASRLDSICPMAVKEAEDGDSVIRGRALIAPGNRHTLLRRSGARYYVEVRNGPLVRRHRPSVDVLFRSAARNAGKNTVGVIMTGMGDDGALGMLEIHQEGGFTIAQDERSCVVFGMPREAIAAGGVDRVLSLESLPGALLSACCGKRIGGHRQ